MNKIRCSMLISAVVFLLIGCATTDKDVEYNGENRYTDRKVGFSICPPASWQTIEVTGFKSKFLFGPPEDNFAPNMNFLEEKIDGGLKQTIDATLPELQKLFADFKLVSRSDFQTESNAVGEKLIYTITQNGIPIRMHQYFIPGRNGLHMIISCGSPGSADDKYDALYDRTVGTFMWTK